MKKFKLIKYNDNKYPVTILDIWYQNNKIVAYVEGTHIYKTEIVIRGNRIDNYYCSCPSCDEGMNFCKHLSGIQNYLQKHEIPELEYIKPKEDKIDFSLSTEEIIKKFEKKFNKFLDKGKSVNCYQSDYISDFIFKYCIYIDNFLDQNNPEEALILTKNYLDYINTIYIYNVDASEEINEILINYLITLITKFNFFDKISEYIVTKYQSQTLDDLGEDILDKIISNITKEEQANEFIKTLKQIKIESYQENNIKEKIRLLKKIINKKESL